MTADQQTLLLIKGTIAELPPADQQQVAHYAQQLRNSIQELGAVGVLAFALVGAEMQMEP